MRLLVSRHLENFIALYEAQNMHAAADRKGISQPALNNYLKGLRRPEIDVAINIHAKTGATLDWIYLGDRSGLPSRLLESLPDLDLPKKTSGPSRNG